MRCCFVYCMCIKSAVATSLPFNGATGATGGLFSDPKKGAAASQALDSLQIGTVYVGRVDAGGKDNSYEVLLSAPACALKGVRLASSIVSGVLGFHDSRTVARGTEVLLVYGNPSVIFAVIPGAPPDSKNGGDRTTTWGDAVGNKAETGTKGSTNIPEDMVTGEFDFDNLFGVGLRFLTSLISMKAGDRAKVECHLLNDMVRIVSQQFRHIHGVGEELIFDHGRPTAEFSYSSYRHELMGKLSESAKLFEMNGDQIDKATIDRVGDVARHRYLEYLGFVGDFVHRFVCDPPTTLVKLTDALSGRRAGKAWEHIGSDGSYVIQSTSEIRLERVTRIPVPHRYASHEDPKVTRERNYRELNKDFLKVWDYGSIADKDAYRTAYQLRQYSRWLTRFQAFSRMLQLDKEYDIGAELDYPEPDWNNDESDREATNPDLDYFEAYSCYSILRDGSQVIHDGYGSGAVFSNGNVQLSASRHLDIEAAGDIRISCSSLFLKVRRHIEVAASAGGIILQSAAFIRALCTRGSIHLRSDAKLPGDPQPAVSADVTPPIEPVVLDAAILLETTAGRLAVRSEYQVSVAVEGEPEESDDSDDRAESRADIVLATNGSLRVRTKKYAIVGAAKDIITSSRNIATKADRWYGNISEVQWGKFAMMPNLGTMQARYIETLTLDAQFNISGPLRGPIPMDSSPKINSKPHSNHITLRGDDVIAWKSDGEKNKEADDSLSYSVTAKTRPISPWELGAADANWEFLTSADYYWDTREEKTGALVQTLTQQYLELDKPTTWGQTEDQYETWTWGSDKLTSTVRIGANKVGFGGKALQYVATGGDNLHTGSGKLPAAFANYAKSRTWETRAVTMRLLKHL